VGELCRYQSSSVTLQSDVPALQLIVPLECIANKPGDKRSNWYTSQLCHTAGVHRPAHITEVDLGVAFGR